jgi:origin recognition complex subunit 2
MMTGHFNLAFYGYGSKRELVNKFVRQFCTEVPTVVVNGYHPACKGPEDVFQACARALLEHYGPPTSRLKKLHGVDTGVSGGVPCSGILPKHRRVLPLEMAQALAGHMRVHPHRRLFIVIHSMDSGTLRDLPVSLAPLGTLPNVHIMASLDTPSAALCFDTVTLASLRLASIDTTTFEPFAVETSYRMKQAHLKEAASFTSSGEPTLGGSVIVTKSGVSVREQTTGDAVYRVLESLSKKQQELFKIIASMQLTGDSAGTAAAALDTGAGGARHGGATVLEVDRDNLYRQARETFTVSNEAAFQGCMAEFRDHRLIVELAGGSSVLVPLRGDIVWSVLQKLGIA